MNNTKELQDSLQEVSVVMRGLKQKIPSNKKFIKTLLHIFAEFLTLDNLLRLNIVWKISFACFYSLP